MNFSTKGLWQNRRYNKGNIKIMMAFWQFFCYRIRLQGCSQFLVLHDFCRSYINSAIFWLWHKSISSRLLSPVPYIFSLSVTNNTFYIFGGSIVADYSKDRVEGGIRQHLIKREVCIGDHQKKFGVGDGIESAGAPITKRTGFWYWGGGWVNCWRCSKTRRKKEHARQDCRNSKEQ